MIASIVDKIDKTGRIADPLKIKSTAQSKTYSQNPHRQKSKADMVSAVGHNELIMTYGPTKETGNAPSSSLSSHWNTISNTIQFARILQNEPNIRYWLNMHLNKERIFKESLEALM